MDKIDINKLTCREALNKNVYELDIDQKIHRITEYTFDKILLIIEFIFGLITASMMAFTVLNILAMLTNSSSAYLNMMLIKVPVSSSFNALVLGTVLNVNLMLVGFISFFCAYVVSKFLKILRKNITKNGYNYNARFSDVDITRIHAVAYNNDGSENENSFTNLITTKQS